MLASALDITTPGSVLAAMLYVLGQCLIAKAGHPL